MNRKTIRHHLKNRILIAKGSSNSQIKKMRRRDSITASIFVATPILVITIYVFLAFGIALVLSLFSGQLDPSLKGLKYTGFKNWSFVFKDPLFAIAIRNTMIFASITTVMNVFGALIIASILNLGKIKNKNLFLTIYFLPQVTSGIASAIIFTKLVGKNGIFQLDLVMNPQDALWIMIISSVWGGISGGMIVFNTAFSGVGNSQYEAAKIDGSGIWTTFWKITVPTLGPILAYSLITSLIGGMGVFDQAFVLSLIGADSESIMTWSLLGFARIISVKGASLQPNVGIGIVVLSFLGLTIFIMTRIVSIIRPLDGK